MPYLASSSGGQFNEYDIECLDQTEAFDRFNRDHNGGGMLAGVPFPGEIVPRRFVVRSDEVPDWGFFESRGGGCAVDDRFVGVVEKIEPGIHRFHKAEIVKNDGSPMSRPQFLINCCANIEAVDLESPQIEKKYPFDDKVKFPKPFFKIKDGRDDLVIVIDEKIYGRAMWFDKSINRLFFSDRMVEEISKIGVKGISLKKCLSSKK